MNLSVLASSFSIRQRLYSCIVPSLCKMYTCNCIFIFHCLYRSNQFFSVIQRKLKIQLYYTNASTSFFAYGSFHVALSPPGQWTSNVFSLSWPFLKRRYLIYFISVSFRHFTRVFNLLAGRQHSCLILVQLSLRQLRAGLSDEKDAAIKSGVSLIGVSDCELRVCLLVSASPT